MREAELSPLEPLHTLSTDETTAIDNKVAGVVKVDEVLCVEKTRHDVLIQGKGSGKDGGQREMDKGQDKGKGRQDEKAEH